MLFLSHPLLTQAAPSSSIHLQTHLKCPCAGDGVESMHPIKKNKNSRGSSLDDFLKEEGYFDEAQAQAVKEVVAWQLAEAVRIKNIRK